MPDEILQVIVASQVLIASDKSLEKGGPSQLSFHLVWVTGPSPNMETAYCTLSFITV